MWNLLGGWTLKTSIGWPHEYWNQGTGSFVIYLFVCLMLFIVVHAAISALSNDTKEVSVGHVWPMLIVAWVLLQFLPQPSSGLRMIPLFPWLYWGKWFSFVISILSWLSAWISISSAQNVRSGSRTDLAAFALLMLCLTALLTPVEISRAFDRASQVKEESMVTQIESNPSQSDSFGDKLKSHREQVGRWEEELRACRQTLERLQQDSQAVVNQLRSTPGSDSKEVSRTRAQRDLALELQELAMQTKALKKEIDVRQSVIVSATSKLRRMERQPLLKRSEVTHGGAIAEFMELQRTLDEQLRRGATQPVVVSQIEADRILSEILQTGSAKDIP